MKVAPFPAGSVSPADVPAGPEPGQRLVRPDDVAPGQSWSTEFREPPRTCRIFVHHGPAGFQAWVNSCPHAGTPLNLVGNRFVNPSGSHYICATHGARFDVSSGLCTLGPCKGERLKALKIGIRDGWIVTL